MKILITLAATFALAGCCCTKPGDVSLDYEVGSPAPIGKDPATKPSKKYPGHFLACRADYSKPKEKLIVDDILKQIENSKTDVVLYFHGGLSSQDYMVDELGKWLMDEVFSKESVKKTLYPVFMNYDADPRDWDNMSIEWKKISNSDSYKDFVKKVEESIGVDKSLSLTQQQDQLSLNAAILINEYSGKSSEKLKADKAIQQNDIEYYNSLLELKTLPSGLAKNNLVTDPVNILSDELQKVEGGYKSSYKLLEEDVPKSLTDASQTTLRVLRILVRFALKTDHGFAATIQEEVLDALFVGWLGEKHWDKVKRHSRQCFAKGSNGRTLVEGIRKLKIKYPDRNYAIHTLSHSAGSIPTAELINYLADNNSEESDLDQVVMLVPAINQQVFIEFVVPNQRTFNNLTVYSLTKHFEREDRVIHEVLYSSSLLYAVSSLGEGERSMDKMLLIEQHMSPEKSPYNVKLYQRLVCEAPDKVWNFFDESDKADFLMYPTKHDQDHRDCATSHEGTKYPWDSVDLTRNYLKLFGVPDADRLDFKKQAGFDQCK